MRLENILCKWTPKLFFSGSFQKGEHCDKDTKLFSLDTVKKALVLLAGDSLHTRDVIDHGNVTRTVSLKLVLILLLLQGKSCIEAEVSIRKIIKSWKNSQEAKKYYYFVFLDNKAIWCNIESLFKLSFRSRSGISIISEN